MITLRKRLHRGKDKSQKWKCKWATNRVKMWRLAGNQRNAGWNNNKKDLSNWQKIKCFTHSGEDVRKLTLADGSCHNLSVCNLLPLSCLGNLQKQKHPVFNSVTFSTTLLIMARNKHTQKINPTHMNDHHFGRNYIMVHTWYDIV